MKIVIDARFWGPSHTGLGVYTKELVLNLAGLDSANNYVILLRKEMEGQVGLPSNFTKRVVEARAYTFKEQLLLPFVLYELKPDLVHFPSVNVPLLYFGNFVVTIHDLIKHQSRGTQTSTHHPLQYWFKYLTYLLLTRIVVGRAKQIIVPSQAVRKEIIEKLKISPGKVSVTYEAATLNKKPVKQFDFPDRFAIYTGNAYPHKNLEVLISIWKTVFDQTKISLVLSSGRGTFSSRIEGIIRKQNAEKYVQYMGFLTDDQLSSAYSHASLHVFPTLLEGFGLPGLDAMNFGLPVVCSDIPVLREVYGDAAHFFNPKDPDDIANKIIEVATDAKLRQKLISAGKKQVKKYSWQKMAKQTLTIYQEIESDKSANIR